MWSSFTIASPDPPATVRDRLVAALTTAAPRWLSGPTTFCGEVWDTGFRVTRNLARMERAMPIVATGQLLPADGGTAVQVATRPQVWIVLVLCVWSAFWVQLLWRRLVSDPLPGGIYWGEIVVLLGFLAFGWVLLFIATTIEERQYQQALARIVAPDAEPGAAADRHLLSWFQLFRWLGSLRVSRRLLSLVVRPQRASVVLEVSDDSGFLAVVVPAAYEGFVAADWQFDQLFRHFAAQMGRRSLLVWCTGLEGMWRVEVRQRRSRFCGFREVSGPLRVVGGSVLLTNYESLTMAAQFADVRLPERHQQDLLVELPDGEYACRVVQMFDPTAAESAGAGKPDFVLEFTEAAGSLEPWTGVPWFEAEPGAAADGGGM